MKKILSYIAASHAAKEGLFFASAFALQGALIYKAHEQATAAAEAFSNLPVEVQRQKYNSDPENKVRTSHDFFGALSLNQMRNDPASHEHMQPLVPFDQVVRR